MVQHWEIRGESLSRGGRDGKTATYSPEQHVLGSTSPGLLLESGGLKGICQKGRNPGCWTGKQLPIRFKGKNAANR